VTFWLADRIDARGWGIEGDTFQTMDGLRDLGAEVWFNLGDRDLAIGLERARRLGQGERLTEAHAAIATALGVDARVLPMSDQPVRTRVFSHERWWSFQEFMIQRRAEGPVEEVEFAGAAAAAPTPEVLAAIAEARAIVIGPSNPVISIGPILALPGLREALEASPAKVVAVSPIVRGGVLKPATVPLMQWAGQPLSATGIAAYYGDVLDGLVADEQLDDSGPARLSEAGRRAGRGPSGAVPVLETDVLMGDAGGRRRVAEQALEFALALR